MLLIDQVRRERKEPLSGNESRAHAYQPMRSDLPKHDASPPRCLPMVEDKNPLFSEKQIPGQAQKDQRKDLSEIGR
jgi:hypothetical protein